MTTIDTDYLVVGAGAAGMAFTDALIADSDAEVVMVERRSQPGGHWNDAYPFVRLHQPSAFYGVASRVLGNDQIDDHGPNAGLYERATGPEICGYFQRVLNDTLLPSGQVRYFGMSEYEGGDANGHHFVSRLTGETTDVRVRRKVVDATYLETPIPSTHTPSFAVDPDARFMPLNDLVALADTGSGFTIIGGGKTAMDACMWLLDNGVAPDAIRWIRPRDAWLLDRLYTQPLDLVSFLIEGVSLNMEAAALAEDTNDLFRRLEASGQLVRLDPGLEPTMFRCATVSTDELDQLRTIENVVGLGRVRRIGTERIELDHDSISTDSRQVHVDCSAGGLRVTPDRPIFQPDRITLQQVRTCQPTFNAALIAFVESTERHESEKNRLCPPNSYPDAAVDWMRATRVSQAAQNAWIAEPDLVAYLDTCRLDAARGLNGHLAEPRAQAAIARYGTHMQSSIDNLEKLAAVAG